MGGCGGRALVREDRAGRTAGGPVVARAAPLGSYVRTGEPLTASKRESLPKTSLPDRETDERPPGDHRVARRRVDGARATGAEPCSWPTPDPCQQSRRRSPSSDRLASHQLQRDDPCLTRHLRCPSRLGAPFPRGSTVCVVSVAKSAVAPPGPIPNPVVTHGSAGEYCGGDSVGGEAAAGATHTVSLVHLRRERTSMSGTSRMPRGGAAAARWAHNPKVAGSNPAPATTPGRRIRDGLLCFHMSTSC